MSRLPVKIITLEPSDYQSAMLVHDRLWRAVTLNKRRGYLLVNRLHPVITLGTRDASDCLNIAPNALDALQIPLAHCDRGGLATYHDLGQIVIYVIVPIMRSGLTVRSLVAGIEQAMADCCKEFGCTAVGGSTNRLPPGTWVGRQKIGSVGIGIRHGVSRHGMAFNWTTDLTRFRLLKPCGRSDIAPTSLSVELNRRDRPVPKRSIVEQTLCRKLLGRIFAADERRQIPESVSVYGAESLY